MPREGEWYEVPHVGTTESAATGSSKRTHWRSSRPALVTRFDDQRGERRLE